MSHLREVKTRRTECAEDSLKLLEEMLEKARNGEIRSVCIIAVDHNEAIITERSKYENHHYLVAGAHYLLNELTCPKRD